VASAESVSAAEGDNLLVIETHTAEDISQVLVSLGSIWQASIGCAARNVLICSSRSVWDDWTLHFLYSYDAGEDPEVGVGDPWELLCLVSA
jgi:hypothetical protein